jgi:hypothetical protein
MIISIELIAFRYNDNKVEVALFQSTDKQHLIRTAIDPDIDQSITGVANKLVKKHFNVNPLVLEQGTFDGGTCRHLNDWSITLPFLCILPNSDSIELSPELSWVDVNKLKKERISYNSDKNALAHKIALPFNHNKLITKAFTDISSKVSQSSTIFYLLGTTFSIADVISAFHYFNLKVSKQTIKNRYINTDIIEETGEFFKYTFGKPARMYKLKEKKLSYSKNSIGN